MKEQKSKREQDKIKELAMQYRKSGYEVRIQPTFEDLPGFLRQESYVPDLLVLSENESLVVEVKTSESIEKVKQLDVISEIVRKQEGWDFVLVLTNPRKRDQDNQVEFSTSVDQIDVSLQKVVEMTKETSRYNDVALLYFWSVLEAILSYGLFLVKSEKKIRQAKTLLRDSQLFGVINRSDYEFYNNLLLKRNRISHGQLNVHISDDDIIKSINRAKRIFIELRRDYSDKDDFNYVEYLKTISESELKDVVDGTLGDMCQDILDDEIVSSAIALTNAYGWYCDDYDIQNIKFNEDGCVVYLAYHLSGDQDLDKPFHGSEINGLAEMVIASEDEVYFQNVTAGLERYDDEF